MLVPELTAASRLVIYFKESDRLLFNLNRIVYFNDPSCRLAITLEGALQYPADAQVVSEV